MKKVIDLTCCCCGNETRGRQWWNRDKGFGLCNKCVDFCKRGETEESFKQCYGIEGVHYKLNQDDEDFEDYTNRVIKENREIWFESLRSRGF